MDAASGRRNQKGGSRNQPLTLNGFVPASPPVLDCPAPISHDPTKDAMVAVVQSSAVFGVDAYLVQIEAGPIGPVFDEVRDALDPWLGEPRWKRSHGRVKLLYRFESSSFPVVRMRVKVEINTREHFAVMGFALRSFAVDSPWFSGTADVRTYHLEELLGTKLRALFQRKKGRDLYDLWLALSLAKVEPPQVLECFRRYMQHGGAAVSRAEFEANLADKLADDLFIADLSMLLPEGGDYDPMVAADLVQDTLISGLAGAPWKGQG